VTKQNITVRELVSKLKETGQKFTLLGVGPVSEIVTKATIQACKNYNCPPIFIASRNQVDLEDFGSGYLMGGMDQKAFVGLINELKGSIGYQGPVYICRDHGGPWQRNKELNEKYPVEKAMEIAKKSFKADIEAGFNYLHIDPTKCPHDCDLDNIVDWTVQLLEFCENVRRELDKDPIDYEVGTEDIQGGLTTDETFEEFLKKISEILNDKHLPLPTCVVAQTGTLTRLDRNVGCFDAEQTKKLVNIAAKYGIGLKEHNGDYLSAASCRVHPDIGITGMNVAPEFGLVETDALLHLDWLEQKLMREGWITAQQVSGIADIFTELTFEQAPWNKWVTKDIKQMPAEEIRSDTALRRLIGRVCGHYVYNTPRIKDARKSLYRNINSFELVEKAEEFVTEKVRDSIEFYLENFRLKDINQHI